MRSFRTSAIILHISAMSDKFIKDPRTAVKVGDVVKVRLLSADPVSKRISLSMKPPPPPKVERPPRPKPEAREKPARKAPETAKEPRRVAAATVPAAAKDAAAAPSGNNNKKQRATPPPSKPQLSIEQKLALLQNKFRTRV